MRCRSTSIVLIACFLGACLPRGGGDADAGLFDGGSGPNDGGNGLVDGGSDPADGGTAQPDGGGAPDAGAVDAGGCAGEGTDCILETTGQPGSCCGGVCGPPLDRWQLNCGSCGNACPSWQICQASQCVDAFTCATTGSCQFPDGSCCGICCPSEPDGCIDPWTDPDHCGSCGHACRADEICLRSTCVAAACAGPDDGLRPCVRDSSPGVCCGGECVVGTMLTDTSCWSCGRGCPVDGVCSISQGCVGDDGSPLGCLDDGQCAGGRVCAEGSCVVATCPAGGSGLACKLPGGRAGSCCGQTCVDVSFDAAHCGRCEIACAQDEWCNWGQCGKRPDCLHGPANVECPLPGGGGAGICCDGSCVRPSSDDSCSACGMACPEGAHCTGGTCQGPDGGTAGCAPGSCAAGAVCVSDYCAKLDCPPGSDGRVCAFGSPYLGLGSLDGTCCSGTCVRLDRDPDHCGACGRNCDGVCAASTCLPFAQGSECTAELGCFDPTLACVDGRCARLPGPALMPGELCATPATTTAPGHLGVGCLIGPQQVGCYDLRSDHQNCGACQAQCPQTSSCVDGLCTGQAQPCRVGQLQGFCNLSEGTAEICCPAGCVDLRSDPANCGQCGWPCPEGQSCVGGKCQ